MGEINGIFLYNGSAQNGATAKLWEASAFNGTPPSYDDDEPESGQVGSSVTTGTTHGCDGAFRFTTDVVDGEYYVSVYYSSHRAWMHFSVESNYDLAGLLTTNEDIAVRKSGVPTRLAKGTEGYVLTVDGGEVVWATPVSGGVLYTEIAPSSHSPSADSTWEDWDLSAIIGAGALAVEIVIATASTEQARGVRKNGSALLRYMAAENDHKWLTAHCECDANRVIEIYGNTEGSTDSFKVIGYWSQV